MAPMTATLQGLQTDATEASAPIRVCFEQGVVRIRFRQRVLDQVHIPMIQHALDQLMTHTDRADVLLDLEHVEYVPSTILGVVVAMHAKALTRGGCLRIANANLYIRDLFSITKLDTMFQMYPSAEEAIRVSNKRRAKPELDRALSPATLE